jgi:hypothetical protein
MRACMRPRMIHHLYTSDYRKHTAMAYQKKVNNVFSVVIMII